MLIAIIPARGGSKRIPRKNIKTFYGKPMIAWSIEAAKRSGLFNKIVVSTDDEEISAIAMAYGADVPFVRPKGLADDHTPTVPVIAHALESLAELGVHTDYACCIYPCAPFLFSKDLAEAFALLQESGSDYAYPVTEFTHPIQRAMKRGALGKMQFITPKHELTRTQDLEQSFHDAGQFYWGCSQAWLERKPMHSGGVGLEIPNWRVVDIDTEEDWRRAELLFKRLDDEKWKHYE